MYVNHEGSSLRVIFAEFNILGPLLETRQASVSFRVFVVGLHSAFGIYRTTSVLLFSCLGHWKYRGWCPATNVDRVKTTIGIRTGYLSLRYTFGQKHSRGVLLRALISCARELPKDGTPSSSISVAVPNPKASSIIER